MFASPSLNNTILTPAKKFNSQSSLTASFLASRATTVDTAKSSPYDARVQNLEKRFSALHKTAEVSVIASKKAEEVENKIKQIDHRIVSGHNLSEDKLKIAEGDINRIEEVINAEKIANDILEERILKEMNLLENNLALDLKVQSQQDHEEGLKMLSKVNFQIQAAREEYYENQQKTHDFAAKNHEEITDRVYNLQQGLRHETKNREVEHDNIIQTVGNTLNKVQETLNDERKTRKETENYLTRQIEAICGDLQHQANTEKQRRERGDNQLLRLLEDACEKLEIRLAKRG